MWRALAELDSPVSVSKGTWFWCVALGTTSEHWILNLCLLFIQSRALNDRNFDVAPGRFGPK